MNTMTRRISSAPFSRLVSITILVFLFCVSVAAFDDRSKTDSGAAAQPAGQDATGGFTGSDSKSATRNASTQPVDANGVQLNNTALPSGQNSIAAKALTVSSKEKFNYFLKRSFLSPVPYATAIAAGAFGEWADDDHHHHAKPGDFAADSATRAARSFAFGTTASFFEKFAYFTSSSESIDPLFQKARGIRWQLPARFDRLTSDGYKERVQIINQEQASVLLAAERHTLQMIAGGASLTDILNELCCTIDVQAHGTISTVLLMDPNGKLMVVGADFKPIEVTPPQLIFGSRTIQGWASGTPMDSEDTLRFAELTGVRPMIETYPLERAAEAYARMLSGDAQFRVVLTM